VTRATESGNGCPPEENIICRCYVVTDAVIRNAVRRSSLREVPDVTRKTGAGGGCQSCWTELQEILDQTWGTAATRPSDEPAEFPPGSETRAIVARLLQEELGALLGLNGIVAELESVRADCAMIRFRGPLVGTTEASFLSLKRHLVRMISLACRRPMRLIELNVLEGRNTRSSARA